VEISVVLLPPRAGEAVSHPDGVFCLLTPRTRPVRASRDQRHGSIPSASSQSAAALIGEAIEQGESDLSWPEFHQPFMEATDYQVDIDEDTFKKILSRKGLKGVGKAGRPIRGL